MLGATTPDALMTRIKPNVCLVNIIKRWMVWDPQRKDLPRSVCPLLGKPCFFWWNHPDAVDVYAEFPIVSFFIFQPTHRHPLCCLKRLCWFFEVVFPNTRIDTPGFSSGYGTFYPDLPDTPTGVPVSFCRVLTPWTFNNQMAGFQSHVWSSNPGKSDCCQVKSQQIRLLLGQIPINHPFLYQCRIWLVTFASHPAFPVQEEPANSQGHESPLAHAAEVLLAPLEECGLRGLKV